MLAAKEGEILPSFSVLSHHSLLLPYRLLVRVGHGLLADSARSRGERAAGKVERGLRASNEERERERAPSTMLLSPLSKLFVFFCLAPLSTSTEQKMEKEKSTKILARGAGLFLPLPTLYQKQQRMCGKMDRRAFFRFSKLEKGDEKIEAQKGNRATGKT